MNIIRHISSGFIRSLRCWKWILVIWISSLLMILLFAVPLESAVKNILGSSMITEKISEGFLLDVISNSGAGFDVVFSSFIAGFSIVILLGILMNNYFAGGLFGSVRSASRPGKSSVFFGNAGSNFWSFLLIYIMFFVAFFILASLIIGIPAVINWESISENPLGIIYGWPVIAFVFLIPVLTLILDYSRAWQVSSDSKNAFKATGNGIKLLFKRFFPSYFAILPVFIIYVLYALFAARVIIYSKPTNGSGIFLVFVLGQILAILKIFIRSWRYGVVTNLYETYY
ncbi:MAG: hypothetical protein KA114_01705 [Bacteroidales bacterium]|nr:hypothetical protein [Bacteroidales bacterium]